MSRRPLERVVESYHGTPCDYVRPADAPVRPGEVCGEIHEFCRGHVRGLTERPERAIKRGDPCGRNAIPGGVICDKHGGSTPQVRRAGRRRAVLERVQGDVGVLLDAARLQVSGRSTVEAIDEARERAGAMVVALGLLVGDLATASDAKVKVVYDEKHAPHVVVRVREPGLLGPDHTGDLQAHPLLRLYGEWLDRSARIEKVAADIGIDERRVALEEEQGRALLAIIRGTLEELGLSMDDPRVKGVLVRHLRLAGEDEEQAAIEAQGVEVPALAELRQERAPGAWADDFEGEGVVLGPPLPPPSWLDEFPPPAPL